MNVAAGKALEDGWTCSKCTFQNKKRSLFTCEMCQVGRSVLKLSPPAPAAISRHESEPVEMLRRSEEDEARNKWQQIVDFCRQSGDKFVDDSFPPAPKSLHSAAVEGVQWLRPSQIASNGDPPVKYAIFAPLRFYDDYY